MSYYEDEEINDGFKIGGSDEDEPLDMPDEINDFGLDEEDPDNRYH